MASTEQLGKDDEGFVKGTKVFVSTSDVGIFVNENKAKLYHPVYGIAIGQGEASDEISRIVVDAKRDFAYKWPIAAL